MKIPTYGQILQKIFKFFNIQIKFESINNETAKIYFLSQSDRVWFRDEKKEYETSKYNEFFIKNKNDKLDIDLVYEILFDFLIKQEYIIIMKNDSILWKIPTFSSIEELIMKLNLNNIV
jgi:hypothetical protein